MGAKEKALGRPAINLPSRMMESRAIILIEGMSGAPGLEIKKRPSRVIVSDPHLQQIDV